MFNVASSFCQQILTSCNEKNLIEKFIEKQKYIFSIILKYYQYKVVWMVVWCDISTDKV